MKLQAFVILLLIFEVITSASHAQWHSSSPGLSSRTNSNLSVYAFADVNSWLFAATDHGVFSSSNNGVNWKGQIWGLRAGNTDLGDMEINDMLVLPHRYYLDHPKWLWLNQAIQQTINDNIEGDAITVDPQGNAIVAGLITGTGYLDGIVLNATPSALLLVKYDINGTVLWTRTAGTPSSKVHYTGVACDSSGNIFAIGLMESFSGKDTQNIDFGQKQIRGIGGGAPFIVSYDASGNFRWAEAATSTGTVHNVFISADSAGNVYIAGSFFTDFSIDGLTVSTIIRHSAFETVQDREDLFLGKLNSEGNIRWLIQSSSHGDTTRFSQNGNGASCDGLCADSHGSCYIIGRSNDTEFVAGKTLTGSFKQFVAKYDAAGNGRWAIPIDGHQQYQSLGMESISCDRSGNIALCGANQGYPITLNDSTYAPTSPGLSGAILAALDSAGRTRWFKKTADGNAFQLCVSGSGNIFVNYFGYTLTFDGDTIRRQPYVSGSPIIKLSSDGIIDWSFADGLSGTLAVGRDQSLYALGKIANVSNSPTPRYGRFGYIGSMALAKLSAEPPGYTIDTDLYILSDNNIFFPSGTFLSVDKGKSWLNLGPGGNQFATIGTTIFVTGNAGIFRSSTFGETWAKVYSGSGNYLHSLDSILDGNIYSSDYGTTWIQDQCKQGDGMEVSIGSRTFLETGAMSFDTCKTWIIENIGLQVSKPGLWNDKSKALGSTGNLLLNGAAILSASANFGETWHRIDKGLSTYTVFSFHQRGNEMLIGTNDGVWRRPIAEIAAEIPNSPPNFDWATQLHAYRDAFGQAIAVDPSGNSVIFGSFLGSIEIGKNIYSRDQASSLPGQDYYLVKNDSAGKVLWSIHLEGGAINDTTLRPSVSIAPSGDIYVGAHFSRGLRTGAFKLTSGNNSQKMFLLKCSANGQVQWLDTIANAGPYNTLGQVAADRNGDVVIVGSATGESSIGGITLPKIPYYRGAFVALFGSDGTTKWAKLIQASPAIFSANAAAISNDNRYFVGGTSHDRGLFIAEYNSNGDLLDTVFAGKSELEVVRSLGVDTKGNVYAEGSLGEPATIGSTMLDPNSFGDARFLAQYKNSHWNWAELIGFRRNFQFRSRIAVPCPIATTPDGSTYVTGLDSVFGQNAFERIQGANYVTKFKSSGEREWTKQICTGYMCAVASIAADDLGSVWTTGSILNTTYYPRKRNDCFDIAFGLNGLRLSELDSNFMRPFVTRLSSSSTPLSVHDIRTHQTQTDILASLYPNPMSELATLQFHLDKLETVRIILCDQLGRKVKDIFTGDVQPGDFKQSFSCNSISNGNYYVRIQCVSGLFAIPLVLLR